MHRPASLSRGNSDRVKRNSRDGARELEGDPSRQSQRARRSEGSFPPPADSVRVDRASHAESPSDNRTTLAGSLRPSLAGQLQSASARVDMRNSRGSEASVPPACAGYAWMSQSGVVSQRDLLRNRPLSARSGHGSLPKAGSSKAFRSIQDAKNAEARLEEKFRLAGASAPADGELAIVIEYCYNSGSGAAQLSTKHDQARYQEEAELVARYLEQYFPGANICIIAEDFRAPRLRAPPRLGAFEVDARQRVDGECVDINLWSKLHTKLWPVWPDWQHMLHALLPVFFLRLRPCAMFADGSVRFLSGLSLSVLSRSSEKLMLRQIVDIEQGVPVHLLRGSYVVSMPASELYYAEDVPLDLSQVPVPPFSDEPTHLLVPVFAKPRLHVKVSLPEVGADSVEPNVESGALIDPRVLAHSDALVSHVFIIVIDKSDGRQVHKQQLPPSRELHIDLSEFRSRVQRPRATLADELAAIAVSAESYEVQPILDHGRGWKLEVYAELPAHPNVVLDPAVARKDVCLTIGGAHTIELQLARARQEVRVVVQSPQMAGAHWLRALPLPPLSVEIRLASTRERVQVEEARPTDASAAVLSFTTALSVNLAYELEICGSETIHAAVQTVSVQAGMGDVVFYVERSSGEAIVQWVAAKLPQAHFAGTLPLLLPFAYVVTHAASGVVVFEGEVDGGYEYSGDRNGNGRTVPQAETTLRAEGALFIGEEYILSLPAGGAVVPRQLRFTPQPTPERLRLELARAHATLSVRFSFDKHNSSHWAASLPLPIGIFFEVVHVSSGARVCEAHADAAGKAHTAGIDALYVGEEYVIRVPATPTLCLSERTFTCEASGNVLELPVSRVAATASVVVRWNVLAADHWAAALPPPASVQLRVTHRNLSAHVYTCTTDASGRAELEQDAALFVGETYEIEAVGTPSLRGASVTFTVGKTPPHVVYLAVERPTQDVTIALAVTRSLNSSLSASLSDVGVLPRGLRYTLKHASLGREVDSGTTDQVGKAVLKRRGTLFVGERYVVCLAASAGIKACEKEFTVAPHHTQVELNVMRATGDVRYRMRCALLGGGHWAAGLPLPGPILYEIRSARGNGQVVLTGSCNDEPGDRRAADVEGMIDGERAGLYVGSSYELRVLGCELFRETSTTFLVSESSGTACELSLQRQSASLQLSLVSSLAGTPHWAEKLRLPGGMRFKLMHATRAHVLAEGVTDASSRALCSASEDSACAVLVGEEYVVHVETDERFVPVSHRFRVNALEERVAVRVPRAQATVNVAFKSVSAGTEHWSAPLALPGSVSFNVWHKGLAHKVLTATGSGAEGASCAVGDLFKAPVANEGAVSGEATGISYSDKNLFVGETYVIEVPEENSEIRPTSAEFVVVAPSASGSAQRVVLSLERATGQIAVHLTTKEKEMPLASGLTLRLVHRGLGVVVVPPVSLTGERTELFGADALLVGQDYTLELMGSAGILPSKTEFTVQKTLVPVSVHVARAPAKAVVTFRSAPPRLDRQEAADPTASPQMVAAAFRAFDSDASGFLSPSELRSALVRLGLETHLNTKIMKKYDADGDRKLDLSEFTHLVSDLQILDVFSKRDADKSGTIEVRELQAALDDLGLATSTAHTGTLLLKYDANKSGKLSLTEFEHLAADLRAFLAEQARARREQPLQQVEVGQQWLSALTLPAGICYEIVHKLTGKVVASGQIMEAATAPCVELNDASLYEEETYILRVPSGDTVLGASCEFSTSAEPSDMIGGRSGGVHEVTLLLPRTCGDVSISFVSYEFGTSHWAASLKLPSEISFEIVHKTSGALVCAGVGGSESATALPKPMMITAEKYELRVLSSAMLKHATCDFTVRTIAQTVEMALERAVGTLNVQLRSDDGLPLPLGVPFQVWHKELRSVVAEGRTTLSAPTVPCALWFVNQGALYVGEEYVASVPAGTGFRCEPQSAVVGMSAQLMQLTLMKAEAVCTLNMVGAHAGTDCLEAKLPLPRDLKLRVGRVVDYSKKLRTDVASAVVESDGKQMRVSYDLASAVQLLAHEAYLIELQPSDVVCAASAELRLDATGRAEMNLAVARVWRPAVVVVLRAAGPTALPSGLRICIKHKELNVVVAETTSTVADTEVRCLVRADAAFFVGETYVVDIIGQPATLVVEKSSFTVGAFPCTDDAAADALLGAASGGVDTVEVLFGYKKCTALLKVQLQEPGETHWSALWSIGTLSLELTLHGSVVAMIPVNFVGNAREATCALDAFAPLYLGHSYEVRTLESVEVFPARIEFTTTLEATTLLLPLKRMWKCASISVRADGFDLPPAVSLQLRHKLVGCVVASAVTDDKSAAIVAHEDDAAQQERVRTLSAQLLLLRQQSDAPRFHTVTEANLSGASCFWTIEHQDASTREKNKHFVRAIAALMSSHPDLIVHVHCETSTPVIAPVMLAAHFELSPTEANAVMERLAMMRTKALMGALIAAGVADSVVVGTYSSGAARDAVTICARAPAWKREYLEAQDRISEGLEQHRQLQRRLLAVNQGPDELYFFGRVTQVSADSGVGVAWTLHSPEDEARSAANKRVLDAVAAAMKEAPLIKVDALIQTGDIWRRLMLAAYCGLRRREAEAEAREKAEALARMRRVMEENDVFFNGAGEEGLISVTQAWAIEHTDRLTARNNQRTLQMIATILKDYPMLRCEVYGATGAATNAPARLSQHFHMDAETQIDEIFDKLAEMRACACVDELVKLGVPREQLFARWEGRKGELKVDFIPHSAFEDPTAALDHMPYVNFPDEATALRHLARARWQVLVAELVARGVEKRSIVIDEGGLDGRTVFSPHAAPLPPPSFSAVLLLGAKDATVGCDKRDRVGIAHFRTPYSLFVGHTYVLESLPLPALGVPAARLEFVMPRRDAHLVLILTRSKGEIVGRVSYSKVDTDHWSALLPLPSPLPFALSKRGQTAVLARGLTSYVYGVSKDETLHFNVDADLVVSETYMVTILETEETHSARREITISSSDPTACHLLVDRRWTDLEVLLWYVAPPHRLDPPLPMTLTMHARHTGLNAIVSSGIAKRDDGIYFGCKLHGAEALYVKQRYTLEIDDPEFQIVADDGDVLVPNCAEDDHAVRQEPIKVRFERKPADMVIHLTNLLAGSGMWSERLPLPARINVCICELSCRDPNVEAREKAEALERMRRVMEENDVFFNGAGDESLASVTQAWAIQHTDGSKARDNFKTLSLISEILKEYPELTCEVYGATGYARYAPQRLADYFGMDAETQIDEIFSKLAEMRARSCLDALVSLGVPRERLFARWEGRAGEIKVDFIPHGAIPSPSIDHGALPLSLHPGAVVFRGETDAEGKCVVGPEHRLFRGCTYFLVVDESDLVAAASRPFTIATRGQTVQLGVMRMTGDAHARFRTEHANSSHWSAPLPLPPAFDYRVVHKGFDIIVHEGSATGAETNELIESLPSEHTLFRGETYLLMVGYAVRVQTEAAALRLHALTRERTVSFCAVAARSTRSAEAAWDLDCIGDEAKRSINDKIIAGVVAIMQEYPDIYMEVHCEIENGTTAPDDLAAYYQLDARTDAQAIFDHLARNRAEACARAIEAGGVDASRLHTTSKAAAARDCVRFVPRSPEPDVGDAKAGLNFSQTEFTVSRHAQDVLLLVGFCASQVNVKFKSTQAHLEHWMHQLRVPTGLRVSAWHPLIRALVTSGVIADGSCFLGGADTFVSHQPYTIVCKGTHLDHEGIVYFDRATAELEMLAPGRQEVFMQLEWRCRQVVLWAVTTPTGTAEAMAKLSGLSATTGSIAFDERSVGLATSLEHPVALRKDANLQSIRRVAAILKEFPELRCEVLGSGAGSDSLLMAVAARAQPGAAFDRTAAMRSLGEARARAVASALFSAGVAAHQLEPRWHPHAGDAHIELVPCVPTKDVEAARLPAGIPFQLRLKVSMQVIYHGVTTESGLQILLSPSSGMELPVYQDYILEALGGAGIQPNAVEFFLDPALPDECVGEVVLPLERCKPGSVTLITRFNPLTPGHWSQAVGLPTDLRYHVVKAKDLAGGVVDSGAADTAVVAGVITDGKSDMLPVNALALDAYYIAMLDDSPLIVTPACSQPFSIKIDEAQVIEVYVSRRTAYVTLVVVSEYFDEQHWAAALPLPDLSVVVRHSATGERVQGMAVRSVEGRRLCCPLDSENLFVGERYSISIVSTFECAPRFEPLELTFTPEADNVSVPMQIVAKLKHRRRDMLVRLLAAYPPTHWAYPLRLPNGVPFSLRHASLGCQVKSGFIYDGSIHLPGFDSVFVGETYAFEIASTVLNDEASKLVTITEDGVPEPATQLLGAHVPTRGGIHVPPPTMALETSEFSFTGWVRFDSRHATAGTIFSVASANGVTCTQLRITAEHALVLMIADFITFKFDGCHILDQDVFVGLTLDHLGTCTIYLNGAVAGSQSAGIGTQIGWPGDIAAKWRVAEDCSLHAREFKWWDACLPAECVLRSFREVWAAMPVDAATAAEVESRSTIVELPLQRARRPLQLHLKVDGEALRRQKDILEAREEVKKFMVDHDVYFNGAAETATQNSELGTRQAWSINHLDEKKRKQNRETLRGIADILERFKGLGCEVQGSTTQATKAPQPLADYFKMDREENVDQIMARLAEQRAEACRAALIEAGVDASRVFLKAEREVGDMKVDFFPCDLKAAQGAPCASLPAGLPFRLMHRRTGDRWLNEATRALRDFSASHAVEFNGAGQLGLPNAAQAWNLNHLNSAVAAANQATLDGIASIMKSYLITESSLLTLEVYGEVAAAQIAPAQIADYYGMHRQTQVNDILDRLAKARANACAAALVKRGLPESKVLVTYCGHGMKSQVRFIARSDRYGPTLPGEHAEFALVYEGLTNSGGADVVCPLPENAALFVDEKYLFQLVPPGAPLSDEATATVGCDEWLFHGESKEFTVLPTEKAPEHALHVESLTLRAADALMVEFCGKQDRSSMELEYERAVPMPEVVEFQIHRADVRERSDSLVYSGRLYRAAARRPDGAESVAGVPQTKLPAGHKFEVRVVRNADTGVDASTTRFVATEKGEPVDVAVCRLRQDVKVRWEWAGGYEYLELPKSIVVSLKHVALRRGTVLDQQVIYRHQVLPFDSVRLKQARERVRSYLENNDVFFNGAKEKATRESAIGIKQAWSIKHLDPVKQEQNWRTIEGVALIMKEFPEIKLKVQGTTTESKPPANQQLADFFNLDRDTQVPMIMEKLAHERAQACTDALVARGVPSASMSVESEASTGEMKVDFIPYTDAVVQASATLPQLLVGEKFSLATVDSAEGSVSGWEPAGCVRTGRCDFTVDPEGQDEVVLKLRPRDATVHVTPVSIFDKGGYNHWMHGCPPSFPEAVEYSLKHTVSNVEKLSGRLPTRTRTQLFTSDKVMDGERYVLSLWSTALALETRELMARAGGTEVVVQLRPREARLKLTLKLAASGVIAEGLTLQIVPLVVQGGGAATQTKALYEHTLTKQSALVELTAEDCQLVIGQAFSLNIDEGGAVVGSSQPIAPQRWPFSIVQEEQSLVITLKQQQPKTAITLRWLAPMPVNDNQGDGDVEVERPPLEGEITYTLLTSSGDEVVASGVKAYAEQQSTLESTELELNKSYLLKTFVTSKWASKTEKIDLSSHTISVPLEMQPFVISPPLRISFTVSNPPASHWAAALGVPPNLGFVIYESEAARDKRGLPLTCGCCSGNDGHILTAALQPRGSYVAHLRRGSVGDEAELAKAFGSVDAVSVDEAQWRACARAAGAAAAFDPASTTFDFDARSTAPRQPVKINLIRRTRAVQIQLASDGRAAGAAGGLKARVWHTRLNAEAAEADADRDGVVRFPGNDALFVGEKYTLQVPGANPTEFTVTDGNEVLVLPTMVLHTPWYDAKPPPSHARERAEQDVSTLDEALKGGLADDVSAVVKVLGSRNAAELQVLRSVYKHKFRKELGEALAQKRLLNKFKSTLLQTLLVRSKPELDAISIFAATQEKENKDKVVIELLCTSQPLSLLELRATYSTLYQKDLLDAIKQVSAASSGVASASVLLCGLVEHAGEASQASYDATAAADAAELRAALQEPDSLAPARVAAVMSRRTRVHLRKVAAEYGDLVADIKKKLQGSMQRAALLLLERSEDYYARKLEAALFAPDGTLHAETLATVIAARYGRDLSGIAHAYETLYNRALRETISERCKSFPDLHDLLLALLGSCPTYDP